MRGADIVILALSVLEDKHSIGTCPESGLLMYFSASFHFEFKATPLISQLSTNLAFACNAAFKLKTSSSLKNLTNYRIIDEGLPLRAVVNE